MARRPNIIPGVKLTLVLPLDVLSRLNAHLYSSVEGRIPHGAYQRFFVERINEFFAKQVSKPEDKSNVQP